MKNFISLLITVFIFLSKTMVAQSVADTAYLKKNQLKASLSLVGIGPVYEHRIANQTTFIAEADMGFGFDFAGGYSYCPIYICRGAAILQPF